MRLMAALDTAGKGSAGRTIALCLVWAVSIMAVDQWTKELILRNYQLGEATHITGFFNIVRAHNTGAAFSFLSNAGGWQRWFQAVARCNRCGSRQGRLLHLLQRTWPVAGRFAQAGCSSLTTLPACKRISWSAMSK